MQTTSNLPPAFDPEVHDAGDIHAYLEAQGFVVEGVSITQDIVRIDTSLDVGKAIGKTPSIVDALQDFAPMATARDQLIDEIDQIDVDTADLGQLRRAVGLMRDLHNQKDARYAR